jgi:hypothetical protein
MLTHSPRASLGRRHLPWAPPTLREHTAVWPERAGHAAASACARGAAAFISRAVGTSGTAKVRNVCGSSAAGRRHGDRPIVAKVRPAKPSTPGPRKRAASALSTQLRPLLIRPLRRRVVTQRSPFSPPLCDRPGCHESPVNSIRNPARYCCSACRQAVRHVLDRERKWRSRGTLDGRRKRALEYQAARRLRDSQQGHTSKPPTLRARPP